MAVRRGLRHQLADQRANGIGAEEHGFLTAARMQQPVGKDMAALPVAAELDLVDSQKIHHPVDRHGFHRADEITGVWWKYLFLAGDQRNGILPLQGNDALIVLPGQQTQRKADHAGGMRQHPLDGEIGLAGIGRSQHCGDPTVLENAAHGKFGSDLGSGGKRWGLAINANFPHIRLHQS